VHIREILPLNGLYGLLAVPGIRRPWQIDPDSFIAMLMQHYGRSRDLSHRSARGYAPIYIACDIGGDDRV
jgi:hypothetical protein